MTDVEDVEDPRWAYDDLAPQRALALGEHITGLRLTAEILETSDYICVSVPESS